MAIRNQDGRLISLASKEMIDEVEGDLLEFGNSAVIAIERLMQGVYMIVDWYYAEDDDEDVREDRINYERSEEMSLLELYYRLVIQDDPVIENMTYDELLRRLGIPVEADIEDEDGEKTT